MNPYPEEGYARALHTALSEALAAELPDAVASVTGAGVHWKCQARRGERQCTVHCFNYPGPQFLAVFREEAGPPLHGRTFDQNQVIGAVRAWLAGQSVRDLFERFAFVERPRRLLEAIERQALALQPCLAALPERGIAPRPDDPEWCALHFRSGDRSCSVGAGYDVPGASAYAAFSWDGTLQFEARFGATPTEIPTQARGSPAAEARDLDAAEVARLAALVKRWLCDRAMPSELWREFPWLTLTAAAPYYEQGRGVEGEFIESWDQVQAWHEPTDFACPHSAGVLNLLLQLRAAGYDRTLRAGMSLSILVLSRSRRYGLRPDQPHVAFAFGGARFTGQHLAPGTMAVTTALGGQERTVAFPSVALSAELDEILKRLEAEPID